MDTSYWDEYENDEERVRPPKKRKVLAAPLADATEEDETQTGPLASFFADKLIVGKPVVVKSGKEATVYCCPAHPETGKTWLAAKVYRPRQQRSFKRDNVYQVGRTTMDSRADRAIANRTTKGMAMQFAQWLQMEYGTLRVLHAAGADVPQPFACGSSALLIEYFGEMGMAAPQLVNVTLQREEAQLLFAQLLRNLAILLDCDRVHGDLSSYNILYWQGHLQIIDFPQAVDPMDNPHAFPLFERDVANVCEYFANYGIRAEPRRLTLDLWLKSGRARP